VFGRSKIQLLAKSFLSLSLYSCTLMHLKKATTMSISEANSEGSRLFLYRGASHYYYYERVFLSFCNVQQLINDGTLMIIKKFFVKINIAFLL
jgi:hypothetical protein